MNLTPDEKKVGQDNYHEAMGAMDKSNYSDAHGVSRRDFLKGVVAAGAVSGAGLGAMYFGYGKVTDPVRVGVIGTGDEGSVLIGAINPDYVQVVAIADIRPYNVHRAFHGDWASPNCTGCATRPDRQIWLEFASRSGKARQSLRRRLSRAAGRSRRRGGDHCPAAASARPGRDRSDAQRQACADREADGPQRGAVQSDGPRGGRSRICCWPPVINATTACSTTTP